jgi:MFS family permease
MKTDVSKKKLTTIHAWAIWLLSAFFMFYKYALEVSPSVMNTTLMKAFNISATQLGNLTACYFYAYLLLQIPAGILLDRFGPRIVTTISIILCSLGSLLFSTADSLLVAGIGRFLTGVGAAFAVVNCLKLIANWFPQKQCAFMTGLMMTVAMLGAVGGQAPLASFIERLDWRYAMEMISYIGLFLGLIFWLVVRDVSPLKAIEKHIVPQKGSLFKNLKHVFKHTQSWWLSIYSGFAFSPVMIFGGLWGVSFISEAFGFTSNISAQAVSLIFIGFAVGAPFFGIYSDFLKRRKTVMVWGTIGALLSISAVIYLPHLAVSTVMLLLFAFGFFISSFLLCFTMIQEIHSPIYAATVIGFMNAFDAFFGAFSDPLTGLFLDLNWDGKMVDGARIFSVENYKLAFITLPVYLFISILSLYFVKETYSKQAKPASLP